MNPNTSEDGLPRSFSFNVNTGGSFDFNVNLDHLYVPQHDPLGFYPSVAQGRSQPFFMSSAANPFYHPGFFHAPFPMDRLNFPSFHAPLYRETGRGMSGHGPMPTTPDFRTTTAFEGYHRSSRRPLSPASYWNFLHSPRMFRTAYEYTAPGPCEANRVSQQSTITIEEIFDDFIVPDLVGEVEEVHSNDESAQGSEPVEEYEVVVLDNDAGHTTAGGPTDPDASRKRQNPFQDWAESENFTLRRKVPRTVREQQTQPGYEQWEPESAGLDGPQHPRFPFFLPTRPPLDRFFGGRW